jgi:hyperosmotically inducible protein
MNKSQVKFAIPLAIAMFTSLVTSNANLYAAVVPQDQQAVAPDNTANNKDHSVTADKQRNKPEDLAMLRKIRKSLVADSSLSRDAHNVKIIVVDGNVTLKGPVKSEDEKQRIGGLATEAAGSADKVVNNITVKS